MHPGSLRCSSLAYRTGTRRSSRLAIRAHSAFSVFGDFGDQDTRWRRRRTSGSSGAAASTRWTASRTSRRSRSRRRSASRRTSDGGRARGQARRLPAAPRARAPAAAVRDQLPREHLRDEDAGRAAHPLRVRGRARSRSNTRRCTSWCPTSSSTARTARRARSSASGLVAHVAVRGSRSALGLGDAGRGLRRRGRGPSRGRHLRLHRGAAVLDPRRVAALPLWGVDVIGMTNLPEAKLAREAEICYATLALVTDYDCWHPRARLGHGRARCMRQTWRRTSPRPRPCCASRCAARGPPRPGVHGRAAPLADDGSRARPADVKRELAPLSRYMR